MYIQGGHLCSKHECTLLHLGATAHPVAGLASGCLLAPALSKKLAFAARKSYMWTLQEMSRSHSDNLPCSLLYKA